MELRIMPSDEMFEEINTVSYLIAVFTNPQIFSDNLVDNNLPELEKSIVLQAIVQTLKELMEELMH